MKKIVIGLSLLVALCGMAAAGGLCTRHNVSYSGSQCPYCKDEDNCYQATKSLQQAQKNERAASDAFRKDRTKENGQKLNSAKKETNKASKDVDIYCKDPSVSN